MQVGIAKSETLLNTFQLSIIRLSGFRNVEKTTKGKYVQHFLQIVKNCCIKKNSTKYAKKNPVKPGFMCS